MRYADWGERSERWSGIRSMTVDVRGTSTHLLRLDAGPDAPPDATVHLFVHAMAGGGTMWLDVLRPLADALGTGHGPLLAVDLPGGMLGHTPAPHPTAVRARPAARFLRALLTELELDRVVLHGWSMGGLVAVLLADLVPDRVAGLVLTAPPLPPALAPRERVAWRVIGTPLLALGEPLARGALRVSAPALVDMKVHAFLDPTEWAERAYTAGGDLSRCSPEILALLTDQLAEVREEPERLAAGATALASVVRELLVDPQVARAAVAGVTAPTLYLWGDADPVVERELVDAVLDQRPDWELCVFETAGHLLPWEMSDRYAAEVAGWLARTT